MSHPIIPYRAGIESLIEEAEDKPEDDTMQRVHTPQANEDLGYDSPKPTPKHPKLSSYEVRVTPNLFNSVAVLSYLKIYIYSVFE